MGNNRRGRQSRKYLLNSNKQTNKQIIKIRENKQPIEREKFKIDATKRTLKR